MPTIEGSYARAGAARADAAFQSGNALGSLGPFSTAGVPSGLNNVAAKGALCIDVTNAKLYINTGTLASNTWTVVGTQT